MSGEAKARGEAPPRILPERGALGHLERRMFPKSILPGLWHCGANDSLSSEWYDERDGPWLIAFTFKADIDFSGNLVAPKRLTDNDIAQPTSDMQDATTIAVKVRGMSVSIIDESGHESRGIPVIGQHSLRRPPYAIIFSHHHIVEVLCARPCRGLLGRLRWLFDGSPDSGGAGLGCERWARA